MALKRRKLLALAGASVFVDLPMALAQPGDEIATIERRVGGRIGVAALDTASCARIAHRADERFAMCSTFKWLLTAAVLAEVDNNRLALEHQVSYGKTDLLPHAPVASAHIAAGMMSIADLCQAAVEESDNTAANLLLALIGGPAGLTHFLRAHGDTTTRLDRSELALNSNLPGDPRDTSTPAAQMATMQTLLLGDVLRAASRERLIDWMKNCRTGLNRLRETGTGQNGAVNDLAIAWPPGRAPILVVAYFSGSTAPLEELEAAHADIARIVAAGFASG